MLSELEVRHFHVWSSNDNALEFDERSKTNCQLLLIRIAQLPSGRVGWLIIIVSGQFDVAPASKRAPESQLNLIFKLFGFDQGIEPPLKLKTILLFISHLV